MTAKGKYRRWALFGRYLPWSKCSPDTRPVNNPVTQLTNELIASYAQAGGINHLDGKNLPSKQAITSITKDLLRLLFPDSSMKN